MFEKPAATDQLGEFFRPSDNPLMNILMRTAAEEIDGINELIELQARQTGRPIVVLPSQPDTIH